MSCSTGRSPTVAARIRTRHLLLSSRLTILTGMSFLDGPRPTAIAHRGGAADGLENSMEAFARCVRLGYSYLETDVHLSADGVVVACHDRDLARTTDRGGRVRDLTWAEISAARIGSEGTVPRLEDLLSAWPHVNLNIDAKVPEVVDPLVRLLRQHGAVDRVCLASFSDRRLARIRRLLPRAATALGPREIARLRVTSYTGGVPSRQLGGDCVQVPPRLGHRSVVDERFVAAAHRLGKLVHVWTIDEPDEMRRLLSLGVDGIMTDRPEVLRDVLVADGRWTDTSRG